MAPAALRRRQGRSARRPVEIACGALGVLLLVTTIVAGFVGPPDPLSNFAPVFVLIVFWVGMAFASVLFGDVFRAFNPWRAAGRACVIKGDARTPTRSASASGPPRSRCSIFTWIELASGWGEHPARLATAADRLLAADLGRDGVLRRRDLDPPRRGASPSTSTCSRGSRSSRSAATRSDAGRCCSGLPPLERVPGTVGFVVVMIGTVTFDGLSQGALWRSLSGGCRRRRRPTRSGCCSASRSSPASTGSGWRAPAPSAAASTRTTLGARVRPLAGPDRRRLRRRALPDVPRLRGPGDPLHGLGPVRPGLGPVRLGQRRDQLRRALAERHVVPPGRRWSCSGTSRRWYWRTTARSPSTVRPRLAVRSQYWMLGIMIGFTSMALWLLAQAGHMSARAALLALAVVLAAGCGGGDDPAPPAAPAKPRSRAAGRLLEEAAVRQHARHRPGDRRLPAHDQPRLLADRQGRQQGHAGQGHPDRRRQDRDGRHVPGDPQHRPGPAARQRPSRQARDAAELPRPAALDRRRQDLERGRAARRRRPAQDRPDPRQAVRVRRRPVGDADLHRRRQDVQGGVHAARADDRLRGRPGRPGADRRLDRHGAVPHRGRREVVAAADARATASASSWPQPDTLYRADKDGTVRVSTDGGTRWKDVGTRRRRALRAARHRPEGAVRSCSATGRSSRPRTEARRGATASGPEPRSPPCWSRAPAARRPLARPHGAAPRSPTSPRTPSRSTRSWSSAPARTSSSATRPSTAAWTPARARPARSPTTPTLGDPGPAAPRPARDRVRIDLGDREDTRLDPGRHRRSRCSAAPAPTSSTTAGGADAIAGDDGDDVIKAGAGDDQVNAGDGDDDDRRRAGQRRRRGRPRRRHRRRRRGRRRPARARRDRRHRPLRRGRRQGRRRHARRHRHRLRARSRACPRPSPRPAARPAATASRRRCASAARPSSAAAACKLLATSSERGTISASGFIDIAGLSLPLSTDRQRVGVGGGGVELTVKLDARAAPRGRAAPGARAARSSCGSGSSAPTARATPRASRRPRSGYFASRTVRRADVALPAASSTFSVSVAVTRAAAEQPLQRGLVKSRKT